MLVGAAVLLVPQVALAALVVAVLAAIQLRPIQELMEQQIQVVAVEATTELQGLLKQAALVLLFFLFQLFIILEQPQAHPQSLHQVQIQF
jgi:hypothetical protein